jgi:hypothetical protein
VKKHAQGRGQVVVLRTDREDSPEGSDDVREANAS